MALQENVRRVHIGKLHAEFKYWNEKGKADTTIPFDNMNLSLDDIFKLWKSEFLDNWNALKTKSDDNMKVMSSIPGGDNLGIGSVSEEQQNALNAFQRYFSPREVKIDKDRRIAIILFDAIDPNGADVTYKNYRTRKSRRNKKEAYEGINYSAHLVIKLDGENGIYDAVLEDVPYLTINAINSILSKMAQTIRNKNNKIFTIKSPTGVPNAHGKVKNEACRLQLLFHQIPDQRFWDVVSRREAVSTLELVNTNPQNDDDITLDFKSCSIVFDLPPQSFFDSAKSNFKKLFSFGKKHHYDFLKVTVQTEAGNSKTVWFNTETELMRADKFTKMELIEGLREKLATATEKINDELVDRMTELLP